jgi:peptidoglycan hydrolase-like protein with peptidoglycan-binding domain
MFRKILVTGAVAVVAVSMLGVTRADAKSYTMSELANAAQAHKPAKVGHRGANVAAIQLALKTADAKAGTPSLNVDGVYGAKTKAAVVKFKTAKGIRADGKVTPFMSPKTWRTAYGECWKTNSCTANVKAKLAQAKIKPAKPATAAERQANAAKAGEADKAANRGAERPADSAAANKETKTPVPSASATPSATPTPSATRTSAGGATAK